MARSVKGLLAVSQEHELEGLLKDDDSLLNTSEDEGDGDRERKHQKLLTAIASLDGKNRWKLNERFEANLQVSEFNVSSEGSGEKLTLSDLLKPMKTSSSLANVKKQLKRVKARKTVELPLHKEERERIYREVAFNRASQALSKWDPIVQKNRQEKQLVFPLKKELPIIVPIEHKLSDLKAKTPLEQEVLNLLHKNKQPVTDPLLTPIEKASLKAMSLEEAKIRRAELQRARALMSYYIAKARRQKKIKSKKYHKQLKKHKTKKTLEELESQQKVNPTAVSDELEKIKTARMMERMSLKHQNSGKWAKSKKIMAKYDLEVCQAMQEQLARNKELTQKLQATLEIEEEEGDLEQEDKLLVLNVVSERQPYGNRENPWMLTSYAGDAREDEMEKKSKQLLKPMAQEVSESEEEKRPEAEEEILLEGHKERQFLREKSELIQNAELVNSHGTKVLNSQKVLPELRTLSQKSNKKIQKGTVVPIKRKKPAEEEEEPLLLQRPARAQILEEQQELDRKGHFQNKDILTPASKRQSLERNADDQLSAHKEKERKEPMIDLQNFLTTKSSSVKSLAIPMTTEELEAEERRAQKQLVNEAFAEDDVINDFLQEKREAVKVREPKDMKLTLPGWGEWGGVGLKPSTKRRRRFPKKNHRRSSKKRQELAKCDYR